MSRFAMTQEELEKVRYQLDMAFSAIYIIKQITDHTLRMKDPIVEKLSEIRIHMNHLDTMFVEHKPIDK